MSIESIWSSKLGSYNFEAPNSRQIKAGRINFFIGPNNSGKSRLLRTLFSSDAKDIQVSVGDQFALVTNKLGKVMNLIRSNPRISNFNSEIFLKVLGGECLSAESIESITQSLGKVVGDAINGSFHIMGGGEETQAFNLLRKLLNDPKVRIATVEAVNELSDIVLRASKFKSHYIPILRGMRPLDDEKDSFLDRTLKDYFPRRSDTNKLNIVTGFNLYQLLVRFLLGQPDDRQRIRQYEEILGREFFGGAEIALIPEYGKDTVSVKIGDDDQFSIYDLGDGMQQVIIITSAAFLERDNSLFYIEEPEACLHPGLLRKLALFLINHTEHQYFATTHSNHLLDLAEVDVRVTIHRVSKSGMKADAKFMLSECTRDRNLLVELGVLASSVYLANSTIWVEGITDRLYLAVFLKKYIETLDDENRRIKLEGLLENFHYAFVEYQGGALAHWSFDDRSGVEGLSASCLCSSVFLLADGDIVGKGERALILEEQLGMRLHILPCKEIENLLPRDILIKTAKGVFSRKHAKTVEGLSSDLLKGLPLKIEESNFGIGYLLDRTLGLSGKGKNVRRVFADSSGTINDKVKFCLAAIDQLNSADWDLGPSLRELCSKIYDHVLERNRG